MKCCPPDVIETADAQLLVDEHTVVVVDAVEQPADVLETPCDDAVSVEADESVVVTHEPEITLLDVGTPGPPGPPGPSGGTAVVRAAGEPLSALRVVFEREGHVLLLNPAAADEVALLLGVSLTAAASIGDDTTVQTLGSIDDAGWSWAEGIVFAGPSGTLTQTPPTSGWEIVIGYAPSPTRLNLTLDEPVLLA